MVLSYNLLPKFKFSGFKFINLDYSFNFDTESGNVFEIKATVTWSKAEIIMQPAYDVSYSAGDTVVSKVFGVGVVLSVKKMGGDSMLEIAFEKAGTKKLMANYAKLEKK